MGIRHERQLHVMISGRCDDRLDEIASAEGFKKSELVRRILWEFLKEHERTNSTTSDRMRSKNFGTEVVRVAYKNG